MSWQARDGSALLQSFSTNDHVPLVIERGEGPFLIDAEGRRYVDALSNLFCAQLGYSYGPDFALAATDSLSTLPFANTWYATHPQAQELAEQLIDRAPPGMGKVFFTCGGSESVESAWKIVRQFHVANGESQRTKAIARRTAYHGVNLGALALTGVPAYKEIFGPPAIPVRHLSMTLPQSSDQGPQELTAALLAEVRAVVEEEGPETIAMLIAEPVQNAGGCVTPPAGYWSGLRGLADEYGFLLVADEVITAFGRLGDWFGSAVVEASPDLITIAKGLTSAYAPMGGVIVSDRVAAVLSEPGRVLVHGLTYSGHPLCAAMALKNVEIFERDQVLQNVRELEPYLRDRLEGLAMHPLVADLRGRGFFWALELAPLDLEAGFSPRETQWLVGETLPAALRDAGVIARPEARGTPALQIAPPLICDREALDLIVDRVWEVLGEVHELRIGAPSRSYSTH